MILQEPPSTPEPGWRRSCAATGSAVGCYDLVDGRLTRTDQVELDVVGERTDGARAGRAHGRGPAAAQRRRPDVRQDPARRALHRPPSIDHLGRPRPAAGPPTGLGRRLGHDPRRRDGHRRVPDAGAGRPARGVRRRRGPEGPGPGSYRHRAVRRRRAPACLPTPPCRSRHAERCSRPRARAATTSSSTPAPLAPGRHRRAGLDLVAGLLDGTAHVPGLVVDTDLRWSLLGRLVAMGRAGEAEIDCRAGPGRHRHWSAQRRGRTCGHPDPAAKEQRGPR